MTGESWGPWHKRARSGELVRLARAWDRRVECPSCKVAVGRACRTSSGHPTDHHRARRDAAGPAPYEQWRKEGLAPELDLSYKLPPVLAAGRAAAAEFRVDQSLADAAVMVRHFLADRLALTLGDEAALDLFDETARTLVLARGPEGAADVITVLVSQVVAFLPMLAGSDRDPEEVYTQWLSAQVAHARRRQREERRMRDEL
ncbi:zinc finger domain-containing protein [Streptomyces sp. NBC_01426]|uniref:zinc finger domain-containing protein n=1 Tax=Streptomyces sp. NBC_01426 TaxID=2975866 RepID=UPI003FCC7036